MVRKILILIILAVTGSTSARKASFVPRSAVNKALTVRGGDHLDPTDTAKVGAVLAGANAVLTLMSPSRTLEVYGAKVSPLSELLAQWQGSNVLGTCLAAWQLIVKGSDLNTAMTSMVLPWTIMQYKTFWNEDHKKVGYPLGPQSVAAVLAPLTLYACASDASFAGTMIKICAVWYLANGVLFTLFPSAACDGYGVEASDENKAAIKTVGYMVAGSGIFQALNVFTDTDPLQAFGYAWVPALIMQIENLLSKEDVNKAPSYAWLIVDLIVVLVCGVQVG